MLKTITITLFIKGGVTIKHLIKLLVNADLMNEDCCSRISYDKGDTFEVLGSTDDEQYIATPDNKVVVLVPICLATTIV